MLIVGCGDTDCNPDGDRGNNNNAWVNSSDDSTTIKWVEQRQWRQTGHLQNEWREMVVAAASVLAVKLKEWQSVTSLFNILNHGLFMCV